MALCALSFTTAFAQDNRGTAEQQAACAPDAFRLCSSYIPDPTDVATCLRQRRSELSVPCRSVFDQADRMAGPAKSRRSSREY
ncbi:hypothetical protein E4K64_14660 [Bradyrhizobium frederickii]|uniref:Cysteine rich repeat-containing protein n=1 Tax=Bradyrhizobium frederickii TaxID=2560054 RepID=A0A4Y9PC22_9BRAD|nr:hypothetical protein E4K64_14660 [Bradyrhizobium frederickii]